MLRRLSGVLAVVTLAGCGAGSNLNKIWGGDDNGADGLLLEAQAAYDEGDFAKADNLCTKLIARNPNNVDAAILLGYVHLSEGGIDPYEIARSLLHVNLGGTTAGTTTAGTTTAGTTGGTTGGTTSGLAGGNGFGSSSGGSGSDGGNGLLDDSGTTAPAADTSSGDAAATLQTLAQALLNLSDADFANLTLGHFGDGATDPGCTKTAANNDCTAPTVFAGKDAIFVPKSVNDALRQSVPVLAYMDKTILTVCSFVDADVKLPTADGDDRDQTPGCATTAGPHGQDKVNLLWALSHLTEALVYESVILYQTAGNSTSSIEDVSKLINAPTITNAQELVTFTGEVVEVKNAVDAVFNTSDPQSMIHASLVSLKEVTNAFGKMSGLPPDIASKITDAYNQIETLGTKLGNGTASITNSTAAFKAQMTNQLGGSLDTNINKAADQAAKQVSGNNAATFNTLTPAQKTQVQTQVAPLCTSFDTLTVGSTLTKPAVCPAG